MEDINVPAPNPFITEWLIGERCRAIMFESAELYQALYRQIVAKRSGALAASAHVSTGIERDRWVSHLEVGNGIAYYAASHEFGTDDGDERIQPGAHDLNVILDMMASL